MKVYIGADHHGYHARSDLLKYLIKSGYDVIDDGNEQLDPNDDFPIFAAKVAHHVMAEPGNRGIVLCGSGQGVCMAANRFRGIRAALGYNAQSVRAVRNDDDANVLCLPADSIKGNEAHVLVDLFLKTSFAAAPRYIRRLKEIDEL
ncbi:MAG: ribose 5-phosphate isomerase B [Candidatus Saccharimonadales bacterium]